MLRGTTPAARDDVGAADERLAAALAGDDAGAIGVALLAARVIVPVVAVRSTGEADMAVPALVAADGRRALPVFTSVDALAAWRAEARPVPMAGARALAAAAAEGYDGVVVDVAGPNPYAVDGADLAALAQAAEALRRHPGSSAASC